MAEHNEIGIAGEAKARQYLMEEGYLILETNWRWHRNELDIIAQKDQTLVVVEVKSRTEDFLLAPEDAIDDRKIRRIVTAADAYMQMHSIENPVRFDIISVVFLHDGGAKIDHLIDAFLPPVFNGKYW